MLFEFCWKMCEEPQNSKLETKRCIQWKPETLNITWLQRQKQKVQEISNYLYAQPIQWKPPGEKQAEAGLSFEPVYLLIPFVVSSEF